MKTLYEVRREMKSGGWSTGPHLRFTSREEAHSVAAKLQDAVRSKGVYVDVFEVAP